MWVRVDDVVAPVVVGAVVIAVVVGVFIFVVVGGVGVVAVVVIDVVVASVVADGDDHEDDAVVGYFLALGVCAARIEASLFRAQSMGGFGKYWIWSAWSPPVFFVRRPFTVLPFDRPSGSTPLTLDYSWLAPRIERLAVHK